jgi:cytochrome P450
MERVNVTTLPTSDLDFWSDEVLLNPYPHYKRLRDAGSAVWLRRHSAWAITRHASVREALLNGEVFSSARGCMMNDATNRAMEGVMLCSDDPGHRQLRRVFARPLMPAALAPLKARLKGLAEQRVDILLERRQFDAVADLAHLLPLTVVTELVGLSDEGKANMLSWAAGIFNAFGPDTHQRTLSGVAIMQQAFVYLQGLTRDSLDPNGWGAALFNAADRGEVSPESAKAMLMDYLAPSLDTTINATSGAIWLFARHFEQWQMLKEHPNWIPQAIDEVLRLESPIRAFSRLITRDYELDGIALPANGRALMLYACANRDERRYRDPETFDIERNARDHVAFGYGTHMCAGMHLARLEMSVLLETLLHKVDRFQLIDASRGSNNTLWGFSRLDVAAEAA